MTTTPELGLGTVLPILAEHASADDGERRWPAPSWEAIRQGGVLAWFIPSEWGGAERNDVDLLTGYEQLASACLTTCFLLSQREAACRRLRDGGSAALRQDLLPR